MPEELDPIAPAPVVVPPAEPEEPGAVDVSGQKMVPLSALLSERANAKSHKEKADQYDAVAGWYQTAKPYIDFLQANPDLISRPQPKAEPVAQPQDDPVAQQLAKTLDLYTPDGKPDVARAKTIVTVIDTIAEAKAEARVRPISESSDRAKSADNFQRALVTVAPDGRRVDPDVLKGIWSKLPASATADETQASVLVYAALGYDVMHKGQPKATPQPTPLVTESNDGRAPNGTALNAFEQRIAASRGLSPADYAKRSEGFIKGRPSALED